MKIILSILTEKTIYIKSMNDKIKTTRLTHEKNIDIISKLEV